MSERGHGYHRDDETETARAALQIRAALPFEHLRQRITRDEHRTEAADGAAQFARHVSGPAKMRDRDAIAAQELANPDNRERE